MNKISIITDEILLNKLIAAGVGAAKDPFDGVFLTDANKKPLILNNKRLTIDAVIMGFAHDGKCKLQVYPLNSFEGNSWDSCVKELAAWYKQSLKDIESL